MLSPALRREALVSTAPLNFHELDERGADPLFSEGQE